MSKKKKRKKRYTRIAGGVVVNYKGRVVVVNQLNNSWSLPKGHIEPGERARQTALREVHEETGILQRDLRIVRKLGTYLRPKVSKDGLGEYPKLIRQITVFLIATGFNGKMTPMDKENPRAIWVRPSKVAKYLTHPKDKKFFRAKLKLVEKFIKKNKPS